MAQISFDILVAAMADRLGENEFTCVYCFNVFDFQKLSLDHKWPISRGGEHDASNITFACLPCNQAKGDLTSNEFETILACLAPMDSVAKKSVLSRLRFGGRMFWKVRK